jgi:hypothetical protein
MDKIKVLFLSANPVATPKLQLDEEIRQIGIKLRAAEYRDAFDFVPRFAARPDDLLQALLEHKPEIVHFSGHGSAAQQLIFVDDQGNEKPVTKEALVHLFRTLKDNIRLVLLNACSTRPQAEAIAETIDCTIGMRKPIGDEAAIVFAASFYRALGFGRSVKEAFELGKAALLLESIPEDKTPELLTRAGVDASAMIFVQPPAAAAGEPAPSKPGGPVSMPGVTDERCSCISSIRPKLLPRQESFASLHILTRRASEGSEALPSLARRVSMSFFGARVIPRISVFRPRNWHLPRQAFSQPIC